MITTIQHAADLSDTQIAVRAAAIRYPDGVPPALAESFVAACEYALGFPEGGWPETVQAWRQFGDQWGCDSTTAEAVVIEKNRMIAARNKAVRARAVVRGRPIAEAVAGRMRRDASLTHRDAVEAIASTYPSLSEIEVDAIAWAACSAARQPE